MKKKYTYILLLLAIISVVVVIFAVGHGAEQKVEEPVVPAKQYIINEIVLGEVVSIKPVRSQKETFDESMNKVEAGMQEVAKKYHIRYGETIIQFTAVVEKVLYVEPLEAGNCTVNIISANNVTINNVTDKPKNI